MLAAFAILLGAGRATAQPPPGVRADTLVLGGPAAAEGAVASTFVAGQRVATWIVEEAGVEDRAARKRPAIEAPAGAVVASFGGGPWFAWPSGPFVWTAPGEGALRFGLNVEPAQSITRPARLAIVVLGTSGSQLQRAFPPPAIALERVPRGVRARYIDLAGFGLVPSTLRLTITTRRGVRYVLAPWRKPGARETFLPLPPPNLSLTPGVHRLDAALEDRLGNVSPAATILFDTSP